MFYTLRYTVIFVLLLSCVAAGQEEGYVASINREVYHNLSCEWAQKIPPENRLYFRTIEEAKASNRRPCRVCRPDEAE